MTKLAIDGIVNAANESVSALSAPGARVPLTGATLASCWVAEGLMAPSIAPRAANSITVRDSWRCLQGVGAQLCAQHAAN